MTILVFYFLFKFLERFVWWTGREWSFGLVCIVVRLIENKKLYPRKTSQEKTTRLLTLMHIYSYCSTELRIDIGTVHTLFFWIFILYILVEIMNVYWHLF